MKVGNIYKSGAKPCYRPKGVLVGGEKVKCVVTNPQRYFEEKRGTKR